MVVDVLERSVSHIAERQVHQNLDFLIGTWVQDAAFNEAMEECERIDEDDWK